uniref:Uncharacterized protein n=1 Tax=Strombidinopsis acuminata TaxID=141414 RepID=A0A7S3U780_9SPIT
MIAVRLCPDNIYRVMCPYNQEITSQSAAFSVFILGVLCIPVVLGALCMLAWRIDFDHPGAVSEDVMEKLRADPRLVDVEVQVEFARSWLEGRFTGEEWQRARRAQVLALGN